MKLIKIDAANFNTEIGIVHINKTINSYKERIKIIGKCKNVETDPLKLLEQQGKAMIEASKGIQHQH